MLAQQTWITIKYGKTQNWPSEHWTQVDSNAEHELELVDKIEMQVMR